MRNFARFRLLLLHKLKLHEKSALGRNLICSLNKVSSFACFISVKMATRHNRSICNLATNIPVLLTCVRYAMGLSSARARSKLISVKIAKDPPVVRVLNTYRTSSSSLWKSHDWRARCSIRRHMKNSGCDVMAVKQSAAARLQRETWLGL